MGSQIYIIISIVILLAIASFAFLVKGKDSHRKLTMLAGISLAFVLCGILFSDNEIFSYSMFGIAIILAMIDITVKLKNK